MNAETHVRILLESCLAARDDENLLISSVWSRELEFRHVNLHQMHVYLFMGMLMEGQLTSASEILRLRDDLQREHPDLRGFHYHPGTPETVKELDDES